MERDAQLRRQLACELGVVTGLWPEGMIQMRSMQTQTPLRSELRQSVQQTHAVRASADAHDHSCRTRFPGPLPRQELPLALRGHDPLNDRLCKGGIGLHSARSSAHGRDYTIPVGRNAFFGPLFHMV